MLIVLYLLVYNVRVCVFFVSDDVAGMRGACFLCRRVFFYVVLIMYFDDDDVAMIDSDDVEVVDIVVAGVGGVGVASIVVDCVVGGVDVDVIVVVDGDADCVVAAVRVGVCWYV